MSLERIAVALDRIATTLEGIAERDSPATLMPEYLCRALNPDGTELCYYAKAHQGWHSWAVPA